MSKEYDVKALTGVGNVSVAKEAKDICGLSCFTCIEEYEDLTMKF